MPRQRANRTGGGRLRVTDDNAITIGAEVEVRPEHLRALHVTKTKENAEETRKTHRCCIKNLIKEYDYEEGNGRRQRNTYLLQPI